MRWKIIPLAWRPQVSWGVRSHRSMTLLAALVADRSRMWTRQPPASSEVVATLAATLPALPPDYLAWLALSNGGEGELGVEPGWFALWPAEEVAPLNAAYEIAALLPGFIGIGSNGGGELLALGPDHAVYMAPFVPMEVGAAMAIAPDFLAFADALGRPLDAI